MALPSYASASALAHEALRGEPLFTLGQARHALGHGDAAGALTAARRSRLRPETGLESGSASTILAASASSLVLEALALRELGRDEDVPGPLQQALPVFAAAARDRPLTGCALAEQATALVLTGRLPDAVEPAEVAVLAGDMLPEDVLLQVTDVLARHGHPGRAEALLRKVLDRGPATPALLGALERLVPADESGVAVRLALVESLLEAGRGSEAAEVAERTVVPGPVPTEVLRVGIRLAAGLDELPPAAEPEGMDDLEDAPAVVQQLAAAMAAAGRPDVVIAGLRPPARPDPARGLLRAAAQLTAGRPRDALTTLEGLPDDRISLRLRAAAYEGLGSWSDAAATLRRLMEWAPDDSRLIASITRLEALAGRSGTALTTVESKLDRRPWDPILLGAQALLLAFRGQHDKAVEVAERALTIRPGLAGAHTALARGLLPTDVGRSLAEADAVLTTDPSNIDALYVKGQALRQRDDLAGATEVLRHLEQVAPWHHPGMLLLAACLESGGAVDDAREVYARLLAERPLDPAPYVAAARLEWQNWRLAEAVALLEQALEHSPDDAEALAGMAEVLRRQDQPEQAETWLIRALEQDPGRPSWLGTQGQLRIAMGKVDEGVDLLRQATARDPSLAWAHVELGEALRLDGRPAEAMAAFEQALALEPDSAWARASTAAALLELGRWDDAQAHVDIALARKPDYAFAWSVKGHVLLQTDDLPGSAEAFDRAVELAPDVGWVWATRAALGRLSGGDRSRVQADLQRALECDPHDVHAQVTLGYLLLELGDLVGGRQLFEEVASSLARHDRDPLDSNDLQAAVWARLGLRDWDRAADLAVDLAAVDDDVTARLTYGLAVLCATSFDKQPDPDLSEYDAALRTVGAQEDRHRRFLLRTAERDLLDLELVAGTQAVAGARRSLMAGSPAEVADAAGS